MSQLNFTNVATPSTPGSGVTRVFVNTTKQPSYVDDAATVGVFVTQDRSETLTNKTLTSPVITGGNYTEALVAAGSTLTLTEASHSGKIIKLDTAAGSTVTLPTSTGGGGIYRFIVSVLATSNSHIVKVANASDIIQGVINMVEDTAGTTNGWASAASSDTITLNRSTTGSVIRGEWLEIIDVTSGIFMVKGCVANSAAGATPFSATV